ncbi:MAG: ATP-binding cassette domain-containing protein [Clostridia bacterium]|nr:ATP-binding cassette domain-containing protein [Clostridia bacterium]
MEILSASHVSINYGAVVAVDDATFSVNEGDYFCIAGSNGSGKSTLLKGIIGLAPIKNGHLHVNLPKEQISYLSQTNRADRDFPATVWEIILSGTQKSGKKIPFYTKDDKQRAEESMIKLGMEKFKNTRIGNLSGGQQQRALLARALCKSPKLMLLDEPFAGLDSAISEELYELYKNLNKNGVTIIMASHDYQAIGNFASRVMLMNNSHVDFVGTNDEWREKLWQKS